MSPYDLTNLPALKAWLGLSPTAGPNDATLTALITAASRSIYSALSRPSLAEATWRAVSFVDPELSYTQFLDLPFSVGELIQAFPAVARATGLRPGRIERQPSPAPATPEASQEVGKSISTP
jgi:hypothetical protein